MTPTTLAAALLKDVPLSYFRTAQADTPSASLQPEQWMRVDDVLAAMTAAMDPALSERAREVLRQTVNTAVDLSDQNMGVEARAVSKAADLITALLAQNAALRAERDAANNGWEKSSKAVLAQNTARAEWQRRAEAAETALAALRAERDDLLNAGTSLVSALCDDPDVMWKVHLVDLINEMAAAIRAARAALSTTEEGHE